MSVPNNFYTQVNMFSAEFKKKKKLQALYDPGSLSSFVFSFLHAVDTSPTPTAKIHHAIVTTETDGYLVSVLKQPTQNKDSYIEVMMTENHPLYNRFHDAVAVLNVAGTQNEVEGIGEAFQTGVYHIVIDVEEHRLLAGV